METLINYLGSGSLYFYPKQNAVALTVVSFSDISQRIIPLFEKSPILGIKQLDFFDWCTVAKIMSSWQHLTSEGLELIRQIKKGMNSNR